MVKIHIAGKNLGAYTAQWLTRNMGYEYMNQKGESGLLVGLQKVAAMLANSNTVGEVLITGFEVTKDVVQVIEGLKDTYGNNTRFTMLTNRSSVNLFTDQYDWLKFDQHVTHLYLIRKWFYLYNERIEARADKKVISFLDAIDAKIRYDRTVDEVYWFGHIVSSMVKELSWLNTITLSGLYDNAVRRLLNLIFKENVNGPEFLDAYRNILIKKALFGEDDFKDKLVDRDSYKVILKYLKESNLIHLITSESGKTIRYLITYRLPNNRLVEEALIADESIYEFDVMVDVSAYGTLSIASRNNLFKADEIARVFFGDSHGDARKASVIDTGAVRLKSQLDLDNYINKDLIPKLKTL